MIQLLFMRHGETVFNVENRWQGWDDSPLTTKGMDQARLLAKKLQTKPTGLLYSSPLGRAYCTAEIILRELPKHDHCKKILTDERLKERHVGILSGITYDEMQKSYPEQIDMRKNDPLAWTPPSGETSFEMIARVTSFMHDVETGKLATSLWVVSHGGVCAQIFCYMQGWDPIHSWSLKIPNTSLTHAIWQESKWHIVESDITLREETSISPPL
jgi:broad specificity phosphatase PhoE